MLGECAGFSLPKRGEERRGEGSICVAVIAPYARMLEKQLIMAIVVIAMMMMIMMIMTMMMMMMIMITIVMIMTMMIMITIVMITNL